MNILKGLIIYLLCILPTAVLPTNPQDAFQESTAERHYS